MLPRPSLRFACLLVALGAAGVHAAEWTQLPYPASSGVSVYADPASARPKRGPLLGYLLGNPIQAWFVTDYAQPHRWGIYPVRSSKQWLEIDCAELRLRVLTRQYFEQPMAQGRVVATEPEARGFTQVAPGEVEESMWQSVCARPAPAPEPTQTHNGAGTSTALQAEPPRPAPPPVAAPPDAEPATGTAL